MRLFGKEAFMAPSGSASFASLLSDYFDYNNDAFGTPPAPQKKYSSCWSNLLQMLFVTTSITVDPPNSSQGLYTQKIAFSNPDSDTWAILPNNMYSVGKMTMTTVGELPPSASGPTPTNTLNGKVAIGSRTDTITVPLDEETTYTHDASTLTIGALLNFFGNMIPGVGTQASLTLPCAIKATAAFIISTVTTGPSLISVDFGVSPRVSIKLDTNAFDPVEKGVLQYINIFAADTDNWQITVMYAYKGITFNTSYPYDQIVCPPDEPPSNPPNIPYIIELVRLLLLTALLSSVIWSGICKYVAGWFSSVTSALSEIAAGVAGGAAAAGVALSMGGLAGGLFGAFGDSLGDPQLLAGALKASTLPDADSPTDVAVAMHSANTDYTAGGIAKALLQTYQATPEVIAQAVAAAFNYSDDQSGVNALLTALFQGQISTDPTTLATTVHHVWSSVPPAEMASGLRAAISNITPGAVAQAVQQTYGATPLAVAQALVAAWNYSSNQAGVNALMAALIQGGITTDPPGLATVTHQVWSAITPALVAVGLCTNVTGLGPIPVASALQAAFAAGQPGALTDVSLATALATAGFSLSAAGQGLLSAFTLGCGPFVADLMNAFRGVGKPPSATDIASTCQSSGYDFYQAFDGMTDPPGNFFDTPTAEAAIIAVYGNIPYWLKLNGGGMYLPFRPQYDFGGGAFTFEVMLRMTAGSGRLVSQVGEVGGGPAPIQLGFDFFVTGGTISFARIRHGHGVSDQATWQTTQPAPILDDEPHTVAVTCDESMEQINIYVDAVAQPVAFQGTTVGGVSSRGQVLIGNADGGTINGGFLMLRLWTVCLSAAQLQSNLTTPPNPDETVGFWNFQDGQIQDQSPVGATATLVGGVVITPVI
jgi:hypothetical protein